MTAKVFLESYLIGSACSVALWTLFVLLVLGAEYYYTLAGWVKGEEVPLNKRILRFMLNPDITKSSEYLAFLLLDFICGIIVLAFFWPIAILILIPFIIAATIKWRRNRSSK